MKKRITITLEDDVLKWLDKNIQKKRFHNYQHAIDYCLSQIMNEENITIPEDLLERIITIPEDLLERIESIIKSGKGGYVDKTSFVLEAIRKRIDELGFTDFYK